MKDLFKKFKLKVSLNFVMYIRAKSKQDAIEQLKNHRIGDFKPNYKIKEVKK